MSSPSGLRDAFNETGWTVVTRKSRNRQQSSRRRGCSDKCGKVLGSLWDDDNGMILVQVADHERNGEDLSLSFCGVFDASTSFVHSSLEGVCVVVEVRTPVLFWAVLPLWRETGVIHIVTRINTRTKGSGTFFDMSHFQKHRRECMSSHRKNSGDTRTTSRHCGKKASAASKSRKIFRGAGRDPIPARGERSVTGRTDEGREPQDRVGSLPSEASSLGRCQGHKGWKSSLLG